MSETHITDAALNGDLAMLATFYTVTCSDSSQERGSGILLDNTHVLTAAHVVNKAGLTVTGITVTPDADTSHTVSSYSSSSVANFTGYDASHTDTENYPYDLAIITLSSSVGYAADKFIGLSAFYGDAPDGWNTLSFGYPGTSAYTQGDMWQTGGVTAHDIGNGDAYYLVGSTTHEGQSGSGWIANIDNSTSAQVGHDLYKSFITTVGQAELRGGPGF